MNFIRDNYESIRFEIASNVWFVRCKLAAFVATVGVILGERALKRGTSNRGAWFSMNAAYLLIFAARLIAPPVIVAGADVATKHAGYR